MDDCIRSSSLGSPRAFAEALCHFVLPFRWLLHWVIDMVSLSMCIYISCLMIVRSVHNAGGAGSMFKEPGTAENTGWAFMFGITAILGAWGAGTIGQSDWTRYANRRYAPTLAQMVAAPVTISVTATIGIIVTSASKDVLGGDLVWNPIYLLADIQENYHASSASRAGVFFASLGLVSSQLAVSLSLLLSGKTLIYSHRSPLF